MNTIKEWYIISMFGIIIGILINLNDLMKVTGAI